MCVQEESNTLTTETDSHHLLFSNFQPYPRANTSQTTEMGIANRSIRLFATVSSLRS